ncbi:hypothetical protein GCM10009853_043690 [Glycomyces scopariae]|uniref:DUF4142 domain-containing protein n=1 Tax=Glycomyces sambucus TaxID=380244 RepID=A0A1G9DUA7_9ACTN|nr:hypothetical protein [Glycomyces sambucus]SDK67447.1 hypothetical protein SAMN05216298_1103 [Glycomyces sambucus]
MFTTRRGLLIGAAAFAAAGCTEQAQITTSDADLTAALRTARALAQGADALGYGEIAEDHRTHAATLERLLRPNTIAEEEAAAPADADALAAAETAGSAEAAESSMTTQSDYAVLFGEIAASRAAHAAVIA